MWIPGFNETTEPDNLGKQKLTKAKTNKLPSKEPKLRETQVSLQSPKSLGTQTLVEKNIFFYGKLYSSCRTSAFVSRPR